MTAITATTTTTIYADSDNGNDKDRDATTDTEQSTTDTETEEETQAEEQTSYLAPTTFHEKGKSASQIISSNIKEIIENQKYVFDNFWYRAIPTKHRILEIEEGIDFGKTDLIQTPEKILELFLKMI